MLLSRKALFLLLLFSYSIASAESFVIHKIHVTGLKRISLGTVLSYLPVKEGESIDSTETSEIIKELYKTNFFTEVTLERRNNDLIVHLVERAVISGISISGNSKITKKQLLEVLKSVAIVEGQALDQAILNSVKQAIIQQYYNLGLYNATVNVEVNPVERNRVAVAIKIKEGPVAKIRSIKIIGNKAFREKVLLKEFSLTTPKMWSFLTHSDQYSKEKLDADLEKLRSYYLDRGYLHIKIDSTRVSITPDKKSIYIVVKIVEGSLYCFSGFMLDGELLGKRSNILKLITLKVGEVFSRKAIIETQERINQFLGDYGYGMSNIKVDPEINEEHKNVLIKFIIHPGHRVYVHHIDFKGNYKTNDEVLRREMRVHEGGSFSLSKINESRRRLANLGYLQDIDYKVIPVTDSNNQVDLLFDVKETSAISANVQAGFSDKDGFLYGASLNDQNVFGTGKSASISFDNTKSTQYYSLGYHDPYFTVNNIGFSLNGYLQRSTPGKVDLSAYTTNICGLLASFDAPLSDYSRVSLGLGFEHIAIGKSYTPSSEVNDFVNKYGYHFNQFKLVSSWSYSNLDRAVFLTSGFANTVSLEGYGSLNSQSLEFYKIDYTACWYYPLVQDFVLRAGAEVGYGDGLGKVKRLPFFKNFFGGGIGSVRGFEAGTLGDNFDTNKKALGGNLLTVASASLIIPTPMKDTIRPSVFVDLGNVYYTSNDTDNGRFNLKDLRASYGIQIEWRTPLAPLIFSLAKPIRSKSGDHFDMFQFSISTSI